jgi:hypothetical protein
MPRFRKLPVVVEAMHWCGDNAPAIRAWMSPREYSFEVMANGLGRLWVAANGAWLTLELDEWIIKDTHGFYPCKQDVFTETYEYVGP